MAHIGVRTAKPLPMDLTSAFPVILPLAVTWAEARSREVQAHGRALDAQQLALARSVDVSRPELVRIVSVSAMPKPDSATLRQAAMQAGLLGSGTVGLTLGYGIILVRGHESNRLLSHELRHVHQYELAGSIAAYLPVYLYQILEFGYHDAPYERDAREHEVAA